MKNILMRMVTVIGIKYIRIVTLGRRRAAFGKTGIRKINTTETVRPTSSKGLLSGAVH
jgi:hypothetical protein